MENECLAIIPARGGSKRIPRKNIRYFLGYPIMKYSIEAALLSDCFDEVMVSTEDDEIAKIAKKYGAKIPFFRSKEMSNDFATTADVIEEVLLEYSKHGKDYCFACCLYPTAPFITPQKLKKGYELLQKTGVNSVIPVVRFAYPIQRALKIENGKLKMILPKNLNKRSQDITPAYHDAGQFYWFRVKEFLKRKTLLTQHAVAYEMSESEVQDIDNLEDWEIAELKYKSLKGNSGLFRSKH